MLNPTPFYGRWTSFSVARKRYDMLCGQQHISRTGTGPLHHDAHLSILQKAERGHTWKTCPCGRGRLYGVRSRSHLIGGTVCSHCSRSRTSPATIVLLVLVITHTINTESICYVLLCWYVFISSYVLFTLIYD